MLSFIEKCANRAIFSENGVIFTLDLSMLLLFDAKLKISISIKGSVCGGVSNREMIAYYIKAIYFSDTKVSVYGAIAIFFDYLFIAGDEIWPARLGSRTAKLP